MPITHLHHCTNFLTLRSSRFFLSYPLPLYPRFFGTKHLKSEFGKFWCWQWVKSLSSSVLSSNLNRAVEKKKAEPVGMDSAKKREKGQRLITRLEKDLADAMKELQALATPSKLAVAALVMAVMFGVKKR